MVYANRHIEGARGHLLDGSHQFARKGGWRDAPSAHASSAFSASSASEGEPSGIRDAVGLVRVPRHRGVRALRLFCRHRAPVRRNLLPVLVVEAGRFGLAVRVGGPRDDADVVGGDACVRSAPRARWLGRLEANDRRTALRLYHQRLHAAQ